MTEQEIEKKLEQFKSGLELFKAKLDDARETIGARDAQIEDIEKDIDVLQKMNNEKAKEIESLKELLSQKDNYEISEQQRHDMNTMNELAGEVSDLEAENEKLLKEKTGLDLENQYLKKEIEKLKQEITEVEDESIEVAHLNNSKIEALDKLRDEVQKAKENSDELYTENGNLKAQITSMELAYQELDLAKAGLEDKLEKEKAKNKTLAEESMVNKSDIDKERTKLSKKIDELKKTLNDTQTLLASKTAEYDGLKKDYESLQVSYNKEKEKVKGLKEKAGHAIVTLPPDQVAASKVIYHYNLGPTSENVMKKFIQVIKKTFVNAKVENGYYILSSIEEAASSLDIGQSDTSVIKTRLLGMKSPDGLPLLIEDNGQLKSRLNCEDFIKWISQIKDK